MAEASLGQQCRDYERIAAAIERLSGDFPRSGSLLTLAAAAGLSPGHFQRVFCRWAGVSPAQFAQFLSVEHAKAALRQGETVLSASLAAQCSSPGRLHDRFVRIEAMTPGDYRRQGAGLSLRYGVHPTPFGRAIVVVGERGIVALRFLVDGPEQALATLRAEWPQARLVRDASGTAAVMAAVFAGSEPALRLTLRGTPFQIQVWRALLALGPGDVTSYGDLAAALGRPRGARAVAGAVAKNPVAYLVPCHRVITRAGQAHGFRWGPARKRAMLGWEAAQSLGGVRDASGPTEGRAALV